jgi:capsule polysaccharide modification protein KpsS
VLADFDGRQVLLLQGPNGPFFRRLGAELRSAGATVSKINLNAADGFFYPGPDAHAYRGSLADWATFLDDFLVERNVDTVFLFGDCRPYHEVARRVAATRGVRVYVFEEGYLRPDYITIERGGVNKNSPMPRDADAYDLVAATAPLARPVKHAFAWSVLFTIANSFLVTFFAFLYPHYRHHRDVNFFRQTALWARSLFRRGYHGWSEGRYLPLLSGPWSKKYFLVGLQVHNDFQVQNSRFGDVEDFIREVVAAFASYGDPSHRLVFKHHPADRAYRDYSALLAQLAAEHQLGQRLVYVHDLHLPTILRHAIGTVVINSTVGLSSLFHHTPVLTLADAVYSRMGLTAPGTLADFFQRPPEVDPARYKGARAWLIRNNQANGSIWVRLPGTGPAGVVWPEALASDAIRVREQPVAAQAAPVRVQAPAIEGAE